MSKMRSVLFVMILVGLMGCTKVGVTQLAAGGRFPAKAENCRLDIYSNAKEITRKHVEVCLIDSRTGTTLFHDKSASAAIEHARPHACKCGADALLVQSADTDGMSFSR